MDVTNISAAMLALICGLLTLFPIVMWIFISGKEQR